MTSKRHVRKRQCESKKRFDTYEAAERTARRQTDRIEYADNLNIYECPWSAEGHPHYHVGHKTMTRAVSVPAYSRYLRDRI